MLTHPTLDVLHKLGLHGLAKGFQSLEGQSESAALPHAEWLGLLLDFEVTLRRQKRFETRMRAARLRHQACIEDVDYRATRGLDRALFLKLTACEWIRLRRNLLITGPTGIGKSWLACALGHNACREDLSVLYYRMPRLFNRTCSGARRWPLCQSLALPRTRRSAHPRRLGTGNLQRRSAPRSARDRRGSL